VAKRMRTIEWLRRKFPGTWRYNAKAGRYEHADGWHVTPYAVQCGYSADDYTTGWMRSDTGQWLYGVGDASRLKVLGEGGVR
jgi:hypothetical protein